MDSEVATRIGLKTYLEITAISKPPEAEEGDWVYVGVQVRNKHTADIYVTVTGTFDGIPTYPLGGAPFVVKAGDYQWWPLHFTMPNKSVTGTVRAFYWSADGWIMDDEQTFSVALAGVPPVILTGRIESPRIKYNLSYVSIYPIKTVPYGENFRIAFTGRNTSSITLQLGGGIAVTDPDGNIVCQEFDWESPPYTGANGTHDFSFPKDSWKNLTIPVDKAGAWRAACELWCWDGNKETKLDRKEYDIFTVPKPEELAGTIVKKQLEYPWGPGGELYNIPVADVPIETKALLHVWGRNDMPSNQKLGLSWVVKDPDGRTVEEGEAWETYHTGPGGQHHFIVPPGALDYINLTKEGRYTFSAQLLMNPDDPEVVDDFEGDLCTVSVEVKYVGEIRNPLVDLKPLWPGGEHAIPYTAEPVPVGQKFNISFDGCNLSDFAMRLRGELWVTSPTGRVAYNRHDISTAPYTYDTCHEFIFKDIPPVDEEGNWTVRMELRNSTGEYLLAEFEDILFSTEILLKGDVGGHVRDAETGYPIEGAVVTVDETGQSDTTSAANAGTYLIRDVPQGNYTLTARATGYESATESDVAVTSEKLTIVDFMLVKAAVVGIPAWLIAAAAIGGAAAIGAVIYLSRPAEAIKKKKD